MAKVVLITSYNEFSVGLDILTSKLIQDGHEVYEIYAKLPIKRIKDNFSKGTYNYVEVVDPFGNIIGGNFQINKWTEKEIEILIKLLQELHPDVIGLSSRTEENIIAQDIYPKIKSQVNATLLAGGYGPSLDPDLYVDLVDYVFIGEAEDSICEIVEKIANNESIEGLPNICFKKDGKIHKNKLAAPTTATFKKRNSPTRAYVIDNNRLYTDEDRESIIPTHTYSTFFGKGCINKCSYCSAGFWADLYRKEGHHVRMRRNRRASDVIAELNSIDRKKVTFIHFRDEFLTSTHKELETFFEQYEKEIYLPFWAYLVPQQVLNFPDILCKAVDAGFVDTEIGLQSGSDHINSTIFNRKIKHKHTLEYAKLLSKFDISIKYDLIIFNHAEKREHIQEAFKLIRALPKNKSYLFLPRLFYYPNTPIDEIMKSYKQGEEDDQDLERFYKQALLYLICFVTKEKEFDSILNNEKLMSSSIYLLEYYKNYLEAHDISFPVGTHSVPDSITTHRYDRIIKKNNYNRIIIWKDEQYFNKMKHIFKNVNIEHIIDHEQVLNIDRTRTIEILRKSEAPIPIFICSADKQKIKSYILNHLPCYSGKIYV